MKKLLSAAALAAFAISGHATLIPSTTGSTTTLTDTFSFGPSECGYITFTYGSCVKTPNDPDGYLALHTGAAHHIDSASFAYTYGSVPTNIEVSFWYTTNGPVVFEFAGTSLVLPKKGYGTLNPGDNFSLDYQAHFNYTFHNVAAGSQTFLLKTGDNGGHMLKVDDLKITVTPVPEPETYAMLLAGLGLMGAVARRRKAPQA
jgi:hypothetical protein